MLFAMITKNPIADVLRVLSVHGVQRLLPGKSVAPHNEVTKYSYYTTYVARYFWIKLITSNFA